MKIRNSIAIVTGANRGIGKALVRALLDAGATRVYAASRSGTLPADLDDTRVTALKLDITDPAQVADAAKKASDVNLLINNAGTLGGGSLLEGDAPLEMARRDLETNYFGTLNMIRAFVPGLQSHEGQRGIVNLLSVVALAGMAGMGGYSASKAAALAMSQAVRAELSSKDIPLFTVFPGPVDTDMTASADIAKASPSDVAENVLAGIEAETEDIFPDPMSSQMEPLWTSGAKQVETMFANF